MPDTSGPAGPRGGPRWSRAALWLLVLSLPVAVLAALCIGAYPVAPQRALHMLWQAVVPFAGADPGWDPREVTVMQVIRPPRVLVATFCGIALGLAGTALQGMMRNPLVGPDLVGVSSGAACGGACAVLLDWPAAGTVALAFAGGMLALFITLTLARLVRLRGDGIALILAGFFVGAFFLALVGLIQYLSQWNKLPMIVYWLLGSFRGADPQKVWTIAVPTLAGGAVLMGLRWRLNLLSLGDLDAASLGIDVRWLRWAVMLVVSWMVAAQVAVSGVVGWVGLVIPHIARMLVGPDHRRLIPASALLGGLFVLGLDSLTRSVIRAEIPVGVLSAFFGTPLIFVLFWKVNSRGWTED